LKRGKKVGFGGELDKKLWKLKDKGMRGKVLEYYMGLGEKGSLW